MKFSSIIGNSQKLDGGAMFGNAPKALWSRWAETDELNRIDLSCRALLVETDQHKILFETGIGAYMEPKYRDRFGVQESHHVLLESLGELGLTHEDITDVVLSHLHFDHAGGLLSAYKEGAEARLLFPNARFYAGKEAFERAQKPHPRDRASFIPGLAEQLQNSGRLHLLTGDEQLTFDDLTVCFYRSSGHTPGMILSDLRFGDNKRLVFAADLIPGRPWVHLPITMGYDRFAEQVIDEKRGLLEDLVPQNGWLFFTHDSGAAAAKPVYNEEKRKFAAGTVMAELKRVDATAL